MCHITYLQPGVEVPTEDIHNAATWNDDGHGWAIAAETGVMLFGRFMEIDHALLTFEATREAYPNAHAMFHSRFATHGVVGLRNVHPFAVGKYAAVAHNGVLPTKFQPSKKDERSDTAILAMDFMPGWSTISGHWSRKQRRRMGRIIGTGNKLCILSVSPYLPQPTGYLVNAGLGEWDWKTGAWHSNRDYQYAWTPRTTSVFGKGGWWDSSDDMKEIGRKAISKNECPICHGLDVDPISNYCKVCETCLDCLEPQRACLCHLPEHARRAIQI